MMTKEEFIKEVNDICEEVIVGVDFDEEYYDRDEEIKYAVSLLSELYDKIKEEVESEKRMDQANIPKYFRSL